MNLAGFILRNSNYEQSSSRCLLYAGFLVGLLFDLKVEAMCFSETLIYFHRTTRVYIPEILIGFDAWIYTIEWAFLPRDVIWVISTPFGICKARGSDLAVLIEAFLWFSSVLGKCWNSLKQATIPFVFVPVIKLIIHILRPSVTSSLLSPHILLRTFLIFLNIPSSGLN